MAIQAQLYSENLGFPLGGGGGGSEDWMENACGGFNDFSFNLQQQQQQLLQKQQHYNHHQQLQNPIQSNQSFCFENNALLPRKNNSNLQPMAFSESIANQVQKQRQEIDRFLNIQNERLRLALQEQRKQQTAALLKKMEAKAEIMLRQKDEEMAKAVNRAMELEEFLRKMEIESQTWQRVAKENEEMVMSLNNTIEQLRESACFSTTGPEDAESCCDNGGDETGEGNRGQEIEEHRTRKMMCKNCNSRNSCVVFLPCRHLCSCKACEAFLDSCPVCGMVKKAGIEALI
ncbi:hypothetical protein RJ640_026507 [Escallonia rubra]|uniref:BOI-related E3 ubiquitin-protein ligase 3 n=1 Tax=Escallonia rubra TaxID=112253 RepID=A0AA88U314_9ASTE|nr:hypothetical protein RJ640_026507 [Escallonia rubra]